jgi:hypothetical protein
MKYFLAIIHTITLLVFPLFTIPFLDWYKLTFCQPDTELYPFYMIITFISVGMLVMTIIRWVVALKDDKNINF